MPDRVTARRALALALARASRLWVASDFDGTLAQIVSHPSRAVLSARARRALRRLAQAPGVSLALISGRTVADLAPRVGLRGVYLAGLSGIETCDGSGRCRRRRLSSIPAPWLDQIERWCERFPGAWIERKGPVAAVHFRAVPSSRQRAFVAGLRRRATLYRDRVELQHGKKVFELRPRGAPDKAQALLTWLGRWTRSSTPSARALVFFGDDENDEEAHALVRRLGGISVAVGRRRSRATFRVQRPAIVVELLEWIARTWRAKQERRSVAATGRRPFRGPRRPPRPAARNASTPRAEARS